MLLYVQRVGVLRCHAAAGGLRASLELYGDGIRVLRSRGIR